MKKMKRNLIVVTLVVALISALCTQVFAVVRTDRCNLVANGEHVGYGDYWYDTLDEYVASCTAQALSSTSGTVVNVTLYFEHYDLGTPDSRGSSSAGLGSSTASITVRPNLGTVHSGRGVYMIDNAAETMDFEWVL